LGKEASDHDDRPSEFVDDETGVYSSPLTGAVSALKL